MIFFLAVFFSYAKKAYEHCQTLLETVNEISLVRKDQNELLTVIWQTRSYLVFEHSHYYF